MKPDRAGPRGSQIRLSYFRATEPELYDKYQTARSIAGAPNPVVAAENPLPIVTNKAD